MTSRIFHGPDWTDALHHLQTGPRFRFADQRSHTMPLVAVGVYAIWHGESLVYVGMAGRGQPEVALTQPVSARVKAKGLVGRLNSHASGRRTGDQFCIYVCDRLVLPNLNREQIVQVAAGSLSLDEKTRAFIHEHLSYSYARTRDGKSALELEAVTKAGAMVAGQPLLNPARRS
ncbi:hypothetical protein [Archangium violaceum]|uniref:hypothetical protein n=1 Tax=Archangium violaceum TaxID=83451 RepID=UPI0036DC7FA6